MLYMYFPVSRLSVKLKAGRPWSFDGDGALVRLVAEAHRIRLEEAFVLTSLRRGTALPLNSGAYDFKHVVHMHPDALWR